MRIRWTVHAADDLQNIKTYLQQNYRISQNRRCAQPTSASVPKDLTEPG
jgi:hypothetical protein